jgi:hypothetical protein
MSPINYTINNLTVHTENLLSNCTRANAMKGRENIEDAVTYIDYDLSRIVDLIVVHIKRFA